jgi:choline dehydrogenase-like flavoprotein
MLPNDFQMKTKYGRGVDWPFPYEELKPYYQMAENEIGVSGDVNAQVYPNTGKDFFGPGYEFPMKEIPQSYMDEILISEVNKKPDVVVNEETYKIYCISTPQGRNSEPNPHYPYTDVVWDPGTKKLVLNKADDNDYEYNPVGSIWDPYTGQRCEGNASCVPICPVQAKYNALKTLKKADHSNLEIRAQSVASRLLINEKSNWISGVEYKRYEHGNAPSFTTEVATGTIYVLAANAIENAKLLLASGAANSSDQVGRNLMDHMVMMAWGLSEKPVYPYRGPGSTTNIATFRDGDFRKEHTAWICPFDNWGWAWPVYSPGSDVSNAVNAGMFGKELRDKLEHDLTRQVFMHHECEQIPEPNNRVTIDPQYKDQIGNYRPVIEYSASDYMRKAFEAANQVTEQVFANCNVTNFTEYKETDLDYVTYNGKGYSFAGAGHIVGTHRMGSSNTDSVVNPDMRTWDHENLYLVGCGNMPTLGTSNPTLTMTALTFKATEAILKQLEQ